MESALLPPIEEAEFTVGSQSNTEPEPVLDSDSTDIVFPEGTEQWKTRTALSKSVRIQRLIIETANAIAGGNPVIWIWAPPGTKDEVKNLWTPLMRDQLAAGKIITPDNDMYSQYFPTIEETPQAPDPVLFTYEDRLAQDLKTFYTKTVEYAGHDPEALGNAVGLDLATLKAFWLVMQVVYPATKRRLVEDQARAMQAAAGVKQAAGGLIVPSQGGIIKG